MAEAHSGDVRGSGYIAGAEAVISLGTLAAEGDSTTEARWAPSIPW
jgi:hypothetical protein